MDYPNSIFHKNFHRINGRKDNHSVQKCMSILLIAPPHMEEFITEAVDQEPFVLDTKTLSSKIS